MKLPVCLFVLLFSVFGYAQQTKIDSLTILFNETKADTTKAEILAKIGIAAYFVDFKKAKFFNDSLISFSKGKSKKHEALGYRMQGTLQLIDGDYSNAQQSYMQSLNIFEDIGDKGYQGALIANLATLYARQNQIDKADSLYLAAIDILKDVKADNQSINCYGNYSAKSGELLTFFGCFSTLFFLNFRKCKVLLTLVNNTLITLCWCFLKVVI